MLLAHLSCGMPLLFTAFGFVMPLPPYFSGLLEKLDKIYGVNLNVAALTGGGNAQDE